MPSYTEQPFERLFLLELFLGLFDQGIARAVSRLATSVSTRRRPRASMRSSPCETAPGISRQWRGRPAGGEEEPLPRWMEALDGFTLAKAFGAGIVLNVLNVLNPKNLLLIVAGATAVAGAGASTSEEVIAWAIFTVIATVGVATPVAIAYVTGDRSVEVLGRLKTWMGLNSAVIMAFVLLLIGVKVLGDGIAGL